MPKKTYRTVGRTRLEEFFARHPDRQFTTEEICLSVNGDREAGRSSVYRHLGELCDADVIQKLHNPERGCHVYQYIGANCDCRNSFHGKCVRCGAIEHLNCHDGEEFASHLLREHGFEVNCGRSVLYGLCQKCRMMKEGDPVNA